MKPLTADAYLLERARIDLSSAAWHVVETFNDAEFGGDLSRRDRERLHSGLLDAWLEAAAEHELPDVHDLREQAARERADEAHDRLVESGAY